MSFDSKSYFIKGLDWQNIDATETQIELCIQYIDLLEKWNKVFNLTSIKDRKELIQLHLLDSLSVLPELKKLYENRGSDTGSEETTYFNRIIDVGTGAGLPGIPLSIFLPEQQFTLLDTRGKKVRFLKQVKQTLKLTNIDPIQARVESYQPAEKYHIILTRAFASVKDILELTQHLCHTNGLFFAMKGKSPEVELDDISQQISEMNIKKLSVYELEAERCLLSFKRV